jgi:hypothetical protein
MNSSRPIYSHLARSQRRLEPWICKACAQSLRPSPRHSRSSVLGPQLRRRMQSNITSGEQKQSTTPAMDQLQQKVKAKNKNTL